MLLTSDNKCPNCKCEFDAEAIILPEEKKLEGDSTHRKGKPIPEWLKSTPNVQKRDSSNSGKQLFAVIGSLFFVGIVIAILFATRGHDGLREKFISEFDRKADKLVKTLQEYNSGDKMETISDVSIPIPRSFGVVAAAEKVSEHFGPVPFLLLYEDMEGVEFKAWAERLKKHVDRKRACVTKELARIKQEIRDTPLIPNLYRSTFSGPTITWTNEGKLGFNSGSSWCIVENVFEIDIDVWIEDLKLAKADMATDSLLILFESVVADDITQIHELIKAGADVNAAASDGVTSLWLASLKDNIDIVKLLLEAGANISDAHTDGRTSLWMASQNDHTEIVKLLLAAKADVNAARKADGTTPLCIASQEGHREVVKLLLAAGADVNAALAAMALLRCIWLRWGAMPRSLSCCWKPRPMSMPRPRSV